MGTQDRIGNEVKSEAKDADISAATLRRASEELGVKKYKSITLGKYVWSLRNSTEKEAMQLAYSGCSSDGGQVAHLAHHFDSEQAGVNLGQNPSKNQDSEIL